MIEHGNADIKSQLDAGASISDFAIVELLEYNWSALSDTKKWPQVIGITRTVNLPLLFLWCCLFLLKHVRTTNWHAPWPWNLNLIWQSFDDICSTWGGGDEISICRMALCAPHPPLLRTFVHYFCTGQYWPQPNIHHSVIIFFQALTTQEIYVRATLMPVPAYFTRQHPNPPPSPPLYQRPGWLNWVWVLTTSGLKRYDWQRKFRTKWLWLGPVIMEHKGEAMNLKYHFALASSAWAVTFWCNYKTCDGQN